MPKRSKQDKKGLFNRALIKALAAAFVIGCIVIIYATERDRAAKKENWLQFRTKSIHTSLKMLICSEFSTAMICLLISKKSLLKNVVMHILMNADSTIHQGINF